MNCFLVSKADIASLGNLTNNSFPFAAIKKAVKMAYDFLTMFVEKTPKIKNS